MSDDGFARGSAQEAREHMRFQNAIEQRLREHGAGYETEPWFPDVIYGAAAAALAAAGAVREAHGESTLSEWTSPRNVP